MKVVVTCCVGTWTLYSEGGGAVVLCGRGAACDDGNNV